MALPNQINDFLTSVKIFKGAILEGTPDELAKRLFDIIHLSRIHNYKNIIFTGKPGTGKDTIMNLCFNKYDLKSIKEINFVSSDNHLIEGDKGRSLLDIESMRTKLEAPFNVIWGYHAELETWMKLLDLHRTFVIMVVRNPYDLKILYSMRSAVLNLSRTNSAVRYNAYSVMSVKSLELQQQRYVDIIRNLSPQFCVMKSLVDSTHFSTVNLWNKAGDIDD